ncbi:MAG: glycerophosphodiester phosphodiesterase family protein [Gammaproteobacteria bacterium]|nr:glycerophosphodiester phosphodiesterase family protein [Gammaproteobacteria bacterium]
MTAHIVAHRGYSSRYPENTSLSLEKAIAAGVRFVELDVQLSADGVPVIVHDDTLQRTGGVNCSVLDTPWSALQIQTVGEVERLGNAFAAEPLPPLQRLTEILQAHPQVHAFVELKEESLNRFGRQYMLDQVVAVLQPVLAQCSIISFDDQVLYLVREQTPCRIGWVIGRWTPEQRKLAEALQPHILICNYKKIELPLWSGPWQWFLYEIIDPALARQWLARGVIYIEGMELAQLLVDDAFNGA